MKILNQFSKSSFLAILCGFFIVTSCKDDLPTGVDSSDKLVELKSIKIINAGKDGNVVVEGFVNQDKKTISFPRLDTLSDFTKIKFEVSLSDGAVLDKESYQVSFDGGKSENSIIIKVVNNPRFREYLTTFRLKVPVYGADFTNGVIHDYSNNPIGNPIYPDYSGQLTRGGAFDGEYVVVPSRLGGNNPHLLKVSDLREGKINKINLNTTGIAGGTLPMQTAAFVNGNLYLFNVSNASGFNIYYYENYKVNYNKAPRVINVPVTGLPVTSTYNTRFGENTSVNLDENGNGYIYMPNNPVQHILRLKIANYTEVVERSVLPLPATGTAFNFSYNQIGKSGQYLATSHGISMFLMDESGAIGTTIAPAVFEATAADARIFNFNNERYLCYMTTGVNSSAVGAFKVYNITNGKTVEDAISFFAAQKDLEKKPVFEFNLSPGPNGAPITHTSWKVEKDVNGKDSKLLLYTTGTDAGFTIFEFPVNVARD